MGSDGQFQNIETLLDTGFNGELTLPSGVIRQLGLERDVPIDVTLATGIRRRVNSCKGQVLWHEKLRSIQVLVSEGNPLLGMELLEDSQLTVQVRPGGDVLIEEMPETRQ